MDVSTQAVRDCLLGRGGPYADPRVATDALDNLAEWCRQLDAPGAALMATALVDLLGDQVAEVRTGAALALAFVAPHLDAAALFDVARRHRDLLAAPPYGFSSARFGTVLAEVVQRAVAAADVRHLEDVSNALDAPPPGLAAPDLGAAAATRLPQLLLWDPARWFDTRATAVLVSFPQHWQRRAFAMALAPWPAEAIAPVEMAARMRNWAEGDLAAVRDVLTGHATYALQPEGLPPESQLPGRWWVVDEAPYDWSVWRHEHGAVALEVLQRGWAMTCRSRLLVASEVEAYRAGGAATLAAAVAGLRPA